MARSGVAESALVIPLIDTPQLRQYGQPSQPHLLSQRAHQDQIQRGGVQCREYPASFQPDGEREQWSFMQALGIAS